MDEDFTFEEKLRQTATRWVEFRDLYSQLMADSSLVPYSDEYISHMDHLEDAYQEFWKSQEDLYWLLKEWLNEFNT